MDIFIPQLLLINTSHRGEIRQNFIVKGNLFLSVQMTICALTGDPVVSIHSKYCRGIIDSVMYTPKANEALLTMSVYYCLIAATCRLYFNIM